MPAARTDRKVATPEAVKKLQDGKFSVKTVQGYNTVFFCFFFFSTCFDLSSSTKVVSSEQMGKYFLCSLELDEDVPVTADMLTDDAMAAFVAYMWTPEKSRSQIRKVQGWFKDRLTEFGLPDPNLGNHEAKFRWRGYIAALAGCRRDPKWSQKQQPKISLDEEQVRLFVRMILCPNEKIGEMK